MIVSNSIFVLVPSGPPVNFTAMAISSTSIVLKWKPPLIHKQNGIITGYTISQLMAGNISTYSTPDLMFTVMDLRPFTSYTYSITAFTVVGSGPSSSTVTDITLEDGNTVISIAANTL